jgi:uncharacterized protein YjiS (DUF1127 family)
MHFENRLPGDRSSRRLLKQRDKTAITLRYSEAGTRIGGLSAASAPRVRSYHEIYRSPAQDQLKGDDIALSTWSEGDRSSRGISVTVSQLMAKAVRGLAACGEAAFPRFLFAVMSWMMAQALAGSIAYAEAMYPCFVDLGDSHDPAAQPENRDPNQLRNQTSALSKIYPIARSEAAGNSQISRQTLSRAVALEAAYVVRSEMVRTASPGWSSSIKSRFAEFRSRMRRERDRRLAIAELRALDDRMLRDIGIFRCDIEYFVRRGDRCE